MSFAFDFADPQFSAPELNAPRPCAHGSNCYYNGPNGCAFVHPGEEGTGMKIFAARSVKDYQTGKESWQKATVRLIGGASFYERRRLKMNWPTWCALPKNAHLPKPSKASNPVAQEKQVQEKQEPNLLAQMIAKAQAEAEKRQQMGNSLYPIIHAFLAEQEKDMKLGGVWHPNMTAGKLTGMLLEAYSYNELYPMLTDMSTLTDNLANCCDAINAHAAIKA
jgi:hypothetical protein